MKITVSSPAITSCAAIRRWQGQIVRLFNPYRPERHYMRGPGPKWREKHGLSTHSITHQFAGAVIAVDGAQTAH